MFKWLKSLFKTKVKKEEPIVSTVQKDVLSEQTMEEEVKAATSGLDAKEDPRPQKVCTNCGAPNDKFVSKCWLCKSTV